MNSHRTEYKHSAHTQKKWSGAIRITHNIQSYTSTSDEHAPIYWHQFLFSSHDDTPTLIVIDDGN